jgi:Domain of unknown function (DUF4357)
MFVIDRGQQMENRRAKTIQVVLHDGNPKGIKIADLQSAMIIATLIPRSLLGQAEARDEIKKVGLYFLFGEDEEENPLVYVGESENCLKRMKQHDQGKDFWNNAIVITTKSEYLNKAHIKYLESFCCTEISRNGRFKLTNNSDPTKSFISEPEQATLMDFFDAIKIILPTLGYPLFESIAKTEQHEDSDILYCKCKGAVAEGRYSEEGFIVFKGSTTALEERGAAGDSIKNIRAKMLEKGILEQEGSFLIFTEDHLFNSPSMASSTVMGGNSNGWNSWVNKEGVTLDELKRKCK